MRMILSLGGFGVTERMIRVWVEDNLSSGGFGIRVEDGFSLGAFGVQEVLCFKLYLSWLEGEDEEKDLTTG